MTKTVSSRGPIGSASLSYENVQPLITDGPSLWEAACITENVYDGIEGKDIVCGWALIEVYEPENTGLRIGVYARDRGDGTLEYVIANKGTNSIPNWIENFVQVTGDSYDMRMSIQFARNFVENHPGANITFVGHSKGGAEAAANAVATNKNAILFNPASAVLGFYGLSSSTYTGTMTAYIVHEEPLNHIFNQVSKPIGNRIYLPQQSINPLYNHSMAGVKKAIRESEGW